MDLIQDILLYYACFAVQSSPNLYVLSILKILDLTIWTNLLKNKSREELEKMRQHLKACNYNYLNNDPLHASIVVDLKTKIEKCIYDMRYCIRMYSKLFGYLALHDHSFCLANFVAMIYEKDGLSKLEFYVLEMQLSKIYVEGKKVALKLRKQLKIPIITIVYAKKQTKCTNCQKLFCPVNRINSYLQVFHAFSTGYTCQNVSI